MSILSGYKRVKNYCLDEDGNFKLLSRWTSANAVDCDDGETVETKVGAIKGITSDSNVTETGYAADMTVVKQLVKQLGDLSFLPITQSDYTALGDNIDENTVYFIY